LLRAKLPVFTKIAPPKAAPPPPVTGLPAATWGETSEGRAGTTAAPLPLPPPKPPTPPAPIAPGVLPVPPAPPPPPPPPKATQRRQRHQRPQHRRHPRLWHPPVAASATATATATRPTSTTMPPVPPVRQGLPRTSTTNPSRAADSAVKTGSWQSASARATIAAGAAGPTCAPILASPGGLLDRGRLRKRRETGLQNRCCRQGLRRRSRGGRCQRRP
jgi:hypothetical protein